MSHPARRQLAENLASVRDRIATAARAGGRSSDDVRLVAVTKYVDVSIAAELLALGHRDLGESRPQQLWQRAEVPELREAQWHLIGHLQRNKAARTVSVASWIHSIDGLRLLDAVAAEAESQSLSPRRVLLEVNLTGESAKHGFAPEELPPLCEQLAPRSGVDVCGLMGMSAVDDDESASRSRFARLRELREDLQRRMAGRFDLRELSMGMSDDFEAGILEGATLVRIGSLLFEGVEKESEA